jgi:hypothetical protein
MREEKIILCSSGVGKISVFVVSIPDSVKFSFLHDVQTDSGGHTAAHQMGTGSKFPRGEVAGL